MDVRSTPILDEVLDFLISRPTLQQITEFHVSEEAQLHVRDLLDRNRANTLSDKEKAEMDEIGQIDHFVTMLKARAHLTLLHNKPSASEELL